jgi:hypothetical protein
LHSRRGQYFLFSTPSRPALGPTQPPIQLIPSEGVLSAKVKRPGRETHRPRPPNAEVKNGGAVPPLTHRSSCIVLNYLSTETTLLFFYLLELRIASIFGGTLWMAWDLPIARLLPAQDNTKKERRKEYMDVPRGI